MAKKGVPRVEGVVLDMDDWGGGGAGSEECWGDVTP